MKLGDFLQYFNATKIVYVYNKKTTLSGSDRHLNPFIKTIFLAVMSVITLHYTTCHYNQIRLH